VGAAAYGDEPLDRSLVEHAPRYLTEFAARD
jgi:hypothetical protein